MSRPLLLTVFAIAITMPGQHGLASSLESTANEPPATTLPDAPSALLPSLLAGSDDPQNSVAAHTGTTTAPTVRPTVKFVAAGRVAPPQQPRDKVLLGLRESVTPFAMVGWVVSAGWGHLVDGSPNYGTNGRAFGQRLGAAAALNSSKEIFSDSILATAFHQDPRYYQLGKSHKFINRGLYAATRPIIGRTDSGKTIPNYAHILGTGGAAALTRTYYPERNQTGGQVVQTWATSLGGSAIGNLVSEFGGEVIGWLRIGKLE
jgi:hypothetical protein